MIPNKNQTSEMLCIAEDINEDNLSKLSSAVKKGEPNYDLLGIRSDADGVKEIAVLNQNSKT